MTHISKLMWSCTSYKLYNAGKDTKEAEICQIVGKSTKIERNREEQWG